MILLLCRIYPSIEFLRLIDLLNQPNYYISLMCSNSTTNNVSCIYYLYALEPIIYSLCICVSMLSSSSILTFASIYMYTCVCVSQSIAATKHQLLACHHLQLHLEIINRKLLQIFHDNWWLL